MVEQIKLMNELDDLNGLSPLVIDKKQIWKFYFYRALKVNWYILFVFALLVFVKVFTMKFHLLLIILTPLILKFIFNAIYYGKFFIIHLKISDNIIDVKFLNLSLKDIL